MSAKNTSESSEVPCADISADGHNKTIFANQKVLEDIPLIF